MNHKSIVAHALSFLSAMCGCGNSSTPANTDPNTKMVTFTKVYTEVISVTCVPCHAPGGVGDAAGGLDMSTQAVAYANLQKSAVAPCSGLARVVPGDAAMSLLVEKVESAHPPCGTQMPYGCGGATPCLSAAQVEEIVDWTNGGAKND